jgi:bifunctional UDP-N-acetylglucosamine pyrophosphorylase/glucosamine-1-phosphate N-acetyltransferase
VLVVSGDHPLISAKTLAALLDTHRDSGAAATLMTTLLEKPGSYGRIIRAPDGEVERIVEAKEPTDATPEELAITEVNAGTYVFQAGPLAAVLERISNDNAQGEYYLGDVLPLLREAGERIAAFRAQEESVTMGVNDRAQLAAVAEEARRRLLEQHMQAGVTIIDPGSTWIDADVELAADVTIEPGSTLRGATSVGSGSVIGPMTTLIDCALADEVSVVHSHLHACEVLAGCTVGPFAHIRPGTTLRERVKAGSFVEIKNSEIGEGAKVPHLAYLGDSHLGESANIGAGTITANYDGRTKHRTVIGRNVRTGVNTSLVAPVVVGEDAYTGAGSVVTEDVPEGALAIARPRQQNVEGYAERAPARARDDGEAERT